MLSKIVKLPFVTHFLCEESARGNWDPREGQQPFQPNPNGVSLGWEELRILLAAFVKASARTPLISFCTVLLRTLCAARSLATLFLSTTSGPGPVELPGFWGSMVLRHIPIFRKGSGSNKKTDAIIAGIFSNYIRQCLLQNMIRLDRLVRASKMRRATCLQRPLKGFLPLAR